MMLSRLTWERQLFRRAKDLLGEGTFPGTGQGRAKLLVMLEGDSAIEVKASCKPIKAVWQAAP